VKLASDRFDDHVPLTPLPAPVLSRFPEQRDDAATVSSGQCDVFVAPMSGTESCHCFGELKLGVTDSLFIAREGQQCVCSDALGIKQNSGQLDTPSVTAIWEIRSQSRPRPLIDSYSNLTDAVRINA